MYFILFIVDDKCRILDCGIHIKIYNEELVGEKRDDSCDTCEWIMKWNDNVIIWVVYYTQLCYLNKYYIIILMKKLKIFSKHHFQNRTLEVMWYFVLISLPGWETIPHQRMMVRNFCMGVVEIYLWFLFFWSHFLWIYP